jgi:anti-sigma regulatory factor (Ser/Thr protein kinase)
MRHLTEDAEIIASELAANAIKAATPPRGTLPAIIFAIHHRPGELRIIVWVAHPPQRRESRLGSRPRPAAAPATPAPQLAAS